MPQLVILVVTAAWLAVLVPPMLRSRVENRPSSSVIDFRRQLDGLQSTATSRVGVRAMGRPLAPSGLGRSAQAFRNARPDRPVLRSGVTEPQRTAAPLAVDERRTERSQPTHGDNIRHRSHGGELRTQGWQRQWEDAATESDPSRRDHTNSRGVDRRTAARRRRANILVLLLGVTAATLYLAAVTSSTAMYYGFAISFVALIGYVYLLAHANQVGVFQRPDRRGLRDDGGWFNP